MDQAINLGDAGVVNFNGQDVEVLQLNSVTIWEKILDGETILNFVGVDASGNYEGTTAFNGTVVAYHVGRPVYSTAEDGTVTTNALMFEYCGGLRKEYFKGYENKIYNEVSDTDKSVLETLIPKEIVIPATYKGLPVTTIQLYAFYGGKEDDETGDTIPYCGAFINKIVIPSSINSYVTSAFGNTGYYNKSLEINGYSPPTIKLTSNDFISVSKNTFYSDTLSGGNWYSVTTMIYDTPHVKHGVGESYLFDNSVCEETVTKLSLTSNACLPTSSSTTKKFVFKNSTANFELNITSQKSASYIKIYTDNESIRNYDWSSVNITPTFYALSEYSGEGA